MIRVDHSQSKHAALPASASERWMNCPGSVAAEFGQPDSVTDYAIEGTAAHALAEHCRRTSTRPALYADEVVTVIETDGEHEVHIGEEMVSAVQAFLDEVDRSLTPDARLYVEKKFDLSVFAETTIGVKYDLGGTTDAAVYQPKQRHLVVADLKYGQGVVVDPKDNPQLLTYALGALIEIEREIGAGRIDNITVKIIQPRAYHAEGGIREWTLTYEDLVAFAVDLLEKAAATRDPQAKRVPGDHCRFCKAAAICPARRKEAESVAMVEFAALPVDMPPDPAKLPAPVLSHVLDNLDILESWVKQVKAHAMGMLERGETIPGYKAVPKRANRKWVDESAVVAWADDMGIRDDVMTAPKVKSVKQVEDIAKGYGGVVVLPESLYEKKSSGFTLAPDADPRPAALIGPAQDFGDNLLPSNR